MPFANRVDRRIWWLTISKAADRSSKISNEDLEVLGLQQLRARQSKKQNKTNGRRKKNVTIPALLSSGVNYPFAPPGGDFANVFHM